MTDLRETAKRIFLETLRVIEPASALKKIVRIDGETLILGSEHLALDAYDEVVLIGMGKASLTMGAAVEGLFGERIKRGILIADRRLPIHLRSEVIVAGHPSPDANSLIAGEKVLNLVDSCNARSLLVFLISGGGSSLVESPLSPRISLDDLRAANQILVGCGATIHEINVVRKALSKIKGGRLGQLASQSTCIAFYISDVNPGDVRSIASNPLLAEEGSGQELVDVIQKFDLISKLPDSVASLIRDCIAGTSEAKHGGGRGAPLTMLLIENSDAVEVAARLAREYGFRVEVDTDLIEGDYRAIADRSVEHLLKLRQSYPDEQVCVISGGEVSCTVRSDGKGGRNQEFVLYSAALLAALGLRQRAVVLSCGTDGIDGNSKATGAVTDADLVVTAARLGLNAANFIDSNDSHSFFKKTGGLVVTGPSGNNVRDLRILLSQ